MGIRIAVDAMGGDEAPGAIVQGAVQALSNDANIDIVLVGREDLVRDELSKCAADFEPGRLEVVHASQMIGMEESPIEALKTKKDSSLAVMVGLSARGEVSASLSAGNTGAYVAACQLAQRPLSCVSRPGIAVTIPTFHGPLVLCDVGANIHAKPRHLYEYAVMSSVYAERVLQRDCPRLGLLSVGEESSKGTGLIRQTHELLSADRSLNFIGNVEGRDLFENRCDVVVCDGFMGNVALKLSEGLAEGLFRSFASEFDHEDAQLKQRIQGALGRLRDRHHYSTYGGAPLMGIDGVCIICHGRSNAHAIVNAIGVAKRFVQEDLNSAIVARLG